MAEHTPGPWKPIPPAKLGKHWNVGAERSFGKRVLYTVAIVENGAPGDTLDTEAANARLIAAAPELLAALELVKAYGSQGDTDDGRSISNVVDMAIAKARGK